MTAPAARVPLVIEPATADDLDAITAIEQHSFKSPWTRAAFAEELTRAGAHLDVVRAADGAVAAFCNAWQVVGEVHIHAIATHPDRRRAGLGAQLLAYVLARGRAGACTLATLEVRRGNRPAIAMYERAGFRTVHTRRAYYQDGEDALVMLADLSDSAAPLS